MKGPRQLAKLQTVYGEAIVAVDKKFFVIFSETNYEVFDTKEELFLFLDISRTELKEAA